ncbi:MAG: HNH endonuclease [Bdellovibrio sp.]|nr:HNH endonuclease [Bdellovibrio sp.]
MDLKKISNAELTLRLEKLVRSERKITHLILVHIIEVESRKIYAELGYDGMFSYLTKRLGYSESAAYRRLQSARLLKAVPSVAEKLEHGSINLSQLTQVQKCLKTETKSRPLEAILAKIENKNTFETKQILAVEFDQPTQAQTVITPQRDESVRIELTFTKKQFEVLQETKELLSHTIHNNSLADVIEHLALKYNKKIGLKNRNEKVKRLMHNELISKEQTCIESKYEELKLEKLKNVKSEKMTRSFAASKMQRPYLSVKLKRQLMATAGHACQYVDKLTGNKCKSKYQLQVDHVHPFAKGGSSELENLQILCRTHNHFKGASN